MSLQDFQLELLAPARTADIGIEAGFAVNQRPDLGDWRFVAAKCCRHIEQFDLLFAVAQIRKLHLTLPPRYP